MLNNFWPRGGIKKCLHNSDFYCYQNILTVSCYYFISVATNTAVSLSLILLFWINVKILFQDLDLYYSQLFPFVYKF